MAARDGVAPLARVPLPRPDLPLQRTSAVVHGASAVDDGGRVADRVVLRTRLRHYCNTAKHVAARHGEDTTTRL